MYEVSFLQPFVEHTIQSRVLSNALSRGTDFTNEMITRRPCLK